MALQFDQSTGGVLTLSASSSGNWSTALPTTYGASTNILGTDGTSLSWIAQTGVSGFATGLSTTSPNATNNVVYLRPSSAGAVVFSPKGSGAFTLRIPDATATGGDVRGSYAVDLTTSGSASTDVASGSYSVAIGSVAKAAGSYSVGAGYGAKVDSDYSMSIGSTPIGSSSNYAVAVGYANQSSVTGGAYSSSIGGNLYATGNYSTYLGGVGNGHSGGYGSFVYPSAGPVLGSSDTTAQVATVIRYALATDTSDATPTIMYTDALTATGNGYLTVANNTSATFKAMIACGVKSSGGNCYGWIYYGSVINNGGTLTVTTGSPYFSGGSSSFTPSVAFSADNTNGALRITVTGVASTAIRWSASVVMTMLTY